MGNPASQFSLTRLFNFNKTVVSGMKALVNPLEKSVIVSYMLEEPAYITLAIHSESEDCVKKLIFIPGNPGGKKGSNKILWDGRDQQGALCSGLHTITFTLNQKLLEESLLVTL